MEKIKVLAVDDEPAHLNLTKICLEDNEDIFVEVAGSALEALAKIDASEYDAVVSDYQMPKMDGLQLLNELNERKCEVPFILFTGKGREDVAVDALNLGASFYLQKGSDPETQYVELANMIRRAAEAFRSKKLLIESELKFRALAEASTEGIMFHDGGIIIDCNPQFAYLFGYEPEEIIGRNGFDFMMSAETRDAILLWLQKGAKGRIDFIGIKKDGTQICAETSAFPVVRNGKTIICVQAYDITEHMRVEETLKESEEKFAKAFHGSVASTFITRLSDGKVIEANDPGLKNLGFTRDEVIGRTTSELQIWMMGQDRQDVVLELEKNGSINNMELQLRKKNGEVWTALYSGQILMINGVEVMLSSLLDITERKRMDEALSKNITVLAKSQEIAHLGSWSLDFETGEFEASDEAYRIYGLVPQSEAILDQIMSLIHPDDLQMYKEYVVSVQQDGRLGGIDYRIVLPEGSIRYLHTMTDSVTRGPDGRVRTASGITQDMTERKNMERVVEEEHSRLKTILDSLPVGVSVADSSGQIILRNRIMHNYLGDAAQSRNLSDLALFRVYRPGSKIPLPAEEMPVARALLRGEVLSNEELEVQRANGERAIVLASALPLRNPDGEVNGSLVVFTDISRLKMLENDLMSSNAELQQFAYVASHDLKAPLTTISSFLQLLQSRYKEKVLDERASGFIDQTVDSSRRMGKLIDDLLEYSKIDQGNGSLEPVDMNVVLDQVRQNLAASISESGAVVSNDSLPTVVANGSQMVQLFQNLVANGIKFHGPNDPRVHVSAEGRGGVWRFSIRDNGIGIDPRYKDRLFQMFSRLHAQSEYEGAGIGLALVKKIVERHGGRVWFESEPGKGSTFYFTLPSK